MEEKEILEIWDSEPKYPKNMCVQTLNDDQLLFEVNHVSLDGSFNDIILDKDNATQLRDFLNQFLDK